jgi:hypothetical protein
MAKRKKSEAPASPSKGGVPARPRRLPALRSNWLLPAWKAALARLQAIDPSAAGLEDELQQETDPVTRARLLAERMAPLDLKTGIAITHGLPLAITEAYKASLRHITDVGQRRLSIAGLKAGEVQEHDLSDRMREFLTRWNEPAEPSPALPPADTIEARATRLPETDPDRP